MESNHRNAWIWLAVVAMAIAVSAQARSSMHSARVYATPVIRFLAVHATDQGNSAGTVQRFLRSRRSSEDSAGNSSVFAAMLPVFFVGLIATPDLPPTRQGSLTGRAPAQPPLPSSFQRPPPQAL